MTQIEGRGQDIRRLLVEPAEHLGIPPRDPRRGIAEPVAIGILTDGDEEVPHGALDRGTVEGTDGTVIVEGHRRDVTHG